ncbi:MAG: hypothetical protein FWD78_02615 [Treponema sp.]|nr:hypothetical protein [Treponema sp.]
MRAIFLMRCAVFFILTLTGLQPLQSQQTPNRKITSIEFVGLWRTKPEIAKYPLEKFLGADSSTLDLNEVNAAVRETNVLEPQSIELIDTDSGVILRITVIDKWSIFPIPVVAWGNGGYSLGLFLTDTNFLGIQDMAVLGGSFGTGGWIALAMYSHTPNKKNMPGWNAFLMGGLRNRADTDKFGYLARRYSIYMLRSSFGMQYPFTGYLSAGAAVNFTNIALTANSSPYNPPRSGAMMIGLSPALSLHTSSWDGVLLSRKILSLEYSFQIGLVNPSYHLLSLAAVFQQPFLPGFRMNLRCGASYRTFMDFGTDLLFEDSPSAAQIDILPGSYVARNYAGFSAGLEKSLFTMRWGTLSVQACWQAVFSYGPVSGYDFNNGPSASIQFYLSRLALPAMGFGINYNMNSGMLQYGLNMGVSM